MVVLLTKKIKMLRKANDLFPAIIQMNEKAPAGEKPGVVLTHVRNIPLAEMAGSQIAVYNGKSFNQIEIKPEMTGQWPLPRRVLHQLYKPVKHGRPGIGATHSSRFIPLK
ncbi:hypothetical protein ZWY2020_044486 [Hordeum vulgare]|nr:hypothetical protein ZWY2020_044486 [Hordeum vulgare]